MGTAQAREGSRDPQHEQPGARDAICSPSLTVAGDAATIGTLLRRVDGGTRERLVGTLQRLHGNAALQRLLAPPDAIPVQRWQVGLPPATTDCDQIVDAVRAQSPYAATSGSAETNVRFRWHGTAAYTETDGALTMSVAHPRVTKAVTVDMPQWAPTDRAVRAAWSASMANLRTHENRHKEIAETWKTTLLGRLAAFSVPVPDRSGATFATDVQAEWDGWIAEHQLDQDRIDPYEAVFTCPTPATAPRAAPAPEAAPAPD